MNNCYNPLIEELYSIGSLCIYVDDVEIFLRPSAIDIEITLDTTALRRSLWPKNKFTKSSVLHIQCIEVDKAVMQEYLASSLIFLANTKGTLFHLTS